MNHKENFTILLDEKRGGEHRGERHHNAKLTQAEVDMARELYEDHGLTIAALARKFNVHWNTMEAIVKYRSW